MVPSSLRVEATNGREIDTSVVEAGRSASTRASTSLVSRCRRRRLRAERGNAKAIVAVTRGGTTARRLTMYRGVVPVCIDIGEHVEIAGPLICAQLGARPRRQRIYQLQRLNCLPVIDPTRAFELDAKDVRLNPRQRDGAVCEVATGAGPAPRSP